MYPLIPADAQITADPPAVIVDGLELPVTAAEADSLRGLIPRLTGRVHLSALELPDRDAGLLNRLRDAGALFDLHVTRDSVPTGPFCDYLYARIGHWRTHKTLDRWPWRSVIAQGAATTGYLQGILTENYHYVRAAAIRQSPLLSHAASPAQFELIRDFVTGEASHERYFMESLSRWGIPALAVRGSVPLASTAEFIGLQYRLAHKSLLDYLAGSAVLEVNPAAYARQGDPYQLWEAVYGIPPAILAPVREHIRDDVEAGHVSLFRQVAEDTAPVSLPLETAVGVLASARTVFDATRLWQRDMYEHYQLSEGHPAQSAL